MGWFQKVLRTGWRVVTPHRRRGHGGARAVPPALWGYFEREQRQPVGRPQKDPIGRIGYDTRTQPLRAEARAAASMPQRNPEESPLTALLPELRRRRSEERSHRTVGRS